MLQSINRVTRLLMAFTAFVMVLIVLFIRTPMKKVMNQQHYTFPGIHLAAVSIPLPVCPNNWIVSQKVTEPYSAIEIHVVGTILERVQQFNLELDKVRNSVWLTRGNATPWTFEPVVSRVGNATVPRTVVAGMNDDFLFELSNFTQVTTMVLPWVACSKQVLVTTEADESNLLVKDYYLWSATEPLCSKIGSKIPINNLKYDNIYRTDCNTDISSSVIERPRSLPRVFLNSICTNRVRYYVTAGGRRTTEQDFYEKSPPITFFCHVIHDAVITDVGDVFTYNLKVVPFGCSDDRNPNLPERALEYPIYDEVFVIAQYWGSAVFHKMIEIMPRVVVYLDFLTRHPNIKILAPEGNGGRLAQLFRIIGLDPERLITGWARAKVAYLPRPSMCGMASAPEVQILSSLYQKYIVENLRRDTIGAIKTESQELLFKPLRQQLQDAFGGKKNTKKKKVPTATLR